MRTEQTLSSEASPHQTLQFCSLLTSRPHEEKVPPLLACKFEGTCRNNRQPLHRSKHTLFAYLERPVPFFVGLMLSSKFTGGGRWQLRKGNAPRCLR